MTTLALFEGLFSGPHMLILLVVAVIIFGHRLPQVARGMGRSINEFKKGLKETGEDAEADGPAEGARRDLPRSEAYHRDLPASDVRVGRETDVREQAR